MAPKECTLCHTPRQILVRCQIDEAGVWNFVCPGKCWKSVSGGIEDAKGLEGQYPYYRYGGMWKDRHADGPVSAKKPRKVKERQKKEAKGRGMQGKGNGAEEGVESGGEDGSEEDDLADDDETQAQDPKDASTTGESVRD